MDKLLKSFDTESKAYSTKLRLEIKSLQLLTSKILSEIKSSKDHEELKESPNKSRLAIDKSCKNISTGEIYDNIKQYLMALIEYFDSREEFQCQFALPAVISCPKLCHLPTLCNMLWRRIEILNKSHDNSKVSTPDSSKETERVSMSVKSSQTEMSSLMYCESCDLSTELIKSLVRLMLDAQRKHNVKETNVSKIRERLKFELFEMSQWGVMKEWTTAIRGDIERLLSLTVSVIKKCDRLTQDQEAMRQESNRSETAFRNDLDLTRKQLEAEQAQNLYLNQQIENLNISLARRIKQEKALLRNIHEYQEKIKFFGESLILIRDDCKQMKASQKSLGTLVKSKMLTQSRNISDLKGDIAFIIEKKEDYFTETLEKANMKLFEVQTILEERDNLILDLTTNISELQSEKKQLNEKIKILTDQKDIQENEMSNIKRKVMELEKLFEESKAIEEYNESCVAAPADKNLKMSGDPLTDMENQRQINKQKIKALLKENANLKTTIFKLKKMKPEQFESRSSMIT